MACRVRHGLLAACRDNYQYEGEIHMGKLNINKAGYTKRVQFLQAFSKVFFALLVFFQTIIWAGNAQAAVSVLQNFPATPTASGTTGATTTTITGTFTPSTGSNSNRLVVCQMTGEQSNTAAATLGAASLGGQTLTVQASYLANRRVAAIYFMKETQIDAMSGNTINIAMTAGGSQTWSAAEVFCATYDGVEQGATTFAGSTAITQNTAAPSFGGNVAVVKGGYIFFAIDCNSGITGQTPPAGYSEHWDRRDSGNQYWTGGGSMAVSADGNQNPTWSLAGTTAVMATVVGSIRPAAGTPPGITVNPTSGLTTTEAGGQATFTIVLDSAPTANVTIGLSSSDTTEGTVSPASVVFTTANWSLPQTVTITGADDALVDGNIAYSVVTAAATSSDGNYSGLNASDVLASNTDNDVPGPGTVQLSTSSYQVDEAAGTVTITVTRTGGSSGAASVNYATSSGSAIQPGDYTSTSGTLNWADGETASKTFSIPIVNDIAPEIDESFSVALSGASGASLGSTVTASVTIPLNDGAVAVPVGNRLLFIMVISGIVAYGLIWQRRQGNTTA